MKPCVTPKPRGSVLILVLMISSVCVLGLTGWMAVIAAKGKFTDTLESAAIRRIAQNNGRRIAAQYANTAVLNQIAADPSSLGLGDSTDTTFEWGGIRVPSWVGQSISSVADAYGINRFSLGDRAGFGFSDANGREIELSLMVPYYNQPANQPYAFPVVGSSEISGNAAQNHDVRYRLQPKSYPALLAGDLLTLHAGPNNRAPRITGSVEVRGRAYFHVPPDNSNAAVTAYARAYEAGVSVGETYYLPSNSNLPAQSTRAWALHPNDQQPEPFRSQVIWDPSWTPAFPNASRHHTLRNKVFEGHDLFPEEYIVDGSIDPSVNSPYPHNSAYTSTGPNHSGSADQQYRVTIDLNAEICGTVVVQNARYLTIHGQNDATSDPDDDWQTVLVVVRAYEPGMERLRHIEFKNVNNKRRFVLGLSAAEWPAGETIDVTFTGSVGDRDWRMALFAENTPLNFRLDSLSPAIANVTITGGLSTDSDLTVTPNSTFHKLTLKRELALAKLVNRLPRRQWVEMIRHSGD